MEPTAMFVKNKKLQSLLVVVLGVILCVIVGGYIYYGMQLAKQNDVSIIPETPSTPTEAIELTAEQKMAILQSLQDNSSSTTPSIQEREKILKSLSTSDETVAATMTQQQKLDVLNSLND